MKINTKHVIGGLWLLFTLSTSSFGVPYASSKCSNKAAGIKHPENGQGVYFSEDCRTAYVLPPELGTAHISAIAQTANLDACPAVNQIASLREESVKAVATIMKKVNKMIKEFDPQSEELNNYKDKLDTLNANHKTNTALLEAAEVELADKKMFFSQAKKSLSDCREINGNESPVCETQQKESNSAKRAWLNYKNNQYQPLFVNHQQTKSARDIAKRKVDRMTSNLDESLEPMLGLKDKLNTLDSELSTAYKEYASVRAMDGQIVYNVDWSAILNGYQELNQDSELLFQKIPIINAKVFATSFVDGKNAIGAIPTLLHAEIPGMTPSGINSIDSEQEVKIDQSLPPVNQSVALGIGDSSISGQIVLSALGACHYFPEGKDTQKDAINFDELSSYLVVNAQYEFPVKARRQYVAKYNLSKMMSRIEKSTKKGGFFRSKTIHSVIEKSSSKDWFDISFDANDPEFTYTPEEQSQITNEVKLGLIQRAINNVAATTFNPAGQPPTLPGMMPTGAAVTAKGLKKACGAWIYCHAGSFILSSLNSIFGKSSAVSNFKRTNNAWVTDSVKQVSVLRRTTSLSFAKK